MQFKVYLSPERLQNAPRLPHSAQQRLRMRWQFPHSPLEGAHIFRFQKKAFFGYLPQKFGAGVSFPYCLFNLGQLWWALGSLPPASHPGPMQWLLLVCHYGEFFCSPNHRSFASDCSQHLPFWHFRRNKIQVWCWKESIDFSSGRISSPYYCFP